MGAETLIWVARGDTRGQRLIDRLPQLNLRYEVDDRLEPTSELYVLALPIAWEIFTFGVTPCYR
jgi:hypothetical protein